jgi:hypothetical protein
MRFCHVNPSSKPINCTHNAHFWDSFKQFLGGELTVSCFKAPNCCRESNAQILKPTGSLIGGDRHQRAIYETDLVLPSQHKTGRASATGARKDLF